MASLLLPIPLTPAERRDLVKRLVERLGTRTAGGFSLFAEDEPDAPGGVVRLKLSGEAGDVRATGRQSATPDVSKAGVAVLQEDAIEIRGLPGGVALALSVRETATTADAPVPVRLTAREGEAAARAAAIEEAYRFAGERFAALLLKKQARLASVALPPLDAEEAARRLRGRWKPLAAEAGSAAIEAGQVASRHAANLVLVEDPRRSGMELLVRAEPESPERQVAPLALVIEGAAIAARTLAAKADGRRLDKALATLAWDRMNATATDPRPGAVEVTMRPGTLHAAALVARVRTATGKARAAAHGSGPRLAAADLSIAAPSGVPGEVHERQLHGLEGDGFVALAAEGGFVGVLVAGPEALVPKWLAKLEGALR